jgi:hypothetical protein
MDLREIGWGSVDWIQLAQDRDRWQALVNTVMNLRVLAPWTLELAYTSWTGRVVWNFADYSKLGVITLLI